MCRAKAHLKKQCVVCSYDFCDIVTKEGIFSHVKVVDGTVMETDRQPVHIGPPTLQFTSVHSVYPDGV